MVARRSHRLTELEQFSKYVNQDYEKLIQGDTTVDRLRNIYFGHRYKENITIEEIEQNSLERNADPRTFGSVYQGPLANDFSSCGRVFKNRIRDMEQSMAQSMVLSQAPLSKNPVEPTYAYTQPYKGSRIDAWIAQSVDLSSKHHRPTEEEIRLKAAYPFISELDSFVKKTQAQRSIVKHELSKALNILTKMSLDDDFSANETKNISRRLESIEMKVGKPHAR